jgi:hypothetical protein
MSMGIISMTWLTITAKSSTSLEALSVEHVVAKPLPAASRSARG